MTRELRRRELRDGAERVPVIAFTGKLGAREIQQCQAAGVDAWLAKPVTFQQLRQVLGDWLPGPRISETAQPVTAVEGRWPSRGRLGQLFGCSEALPGILASLVYEAELDLHALAQATDGLQAQATVEHLHRLIGSVVVLRRHTAGNARSSVDRGDQPRRRGHAPSALARLAQRLDGVSEIFVAIRKRMTAKTDGFCRSSEWAISFFSVG